MIELVLIIAAIVGLGGFSAAETVLLSIDRIRLSGRVLSQGSAWWKASYLIDRPERFVVATLTGSNLLSVFSSSLAALAMERRGVSHIVILVSIPLVLLILGEVLPKGIGRQSAERLAPVFGFGVYHTRQVIWPLLWLVEWSTRILQRWFRTPPEPAGLLMTRSDLGDAVRLARRDGTLNFHEERIIARLLKVEDTLVADILTPRTQVAAISIDTSVKETIAKFNQSSYRRLICYGDSIDDVLGVVHAADFIDPPERIRDVVRTLPMVPESLESIRLIEWFRRERAHFAGVIDEYGGFAGVVSVEDVIEELVGPLHEEDDKEATNIIRLNDRTYLVTGQAKVSHLEQVAGIEFRGIDAGSLSGLIIQIAGKVPQSGQEIRLGETTFRILKSDARGVQLAKMALSKLKRGA